jgi:hypothetical protein
MTLILTFVAWRAADRSSMSIPWRYAGRCFLAALPYVLLVGLAATHLRVRTLLLAASLLGAIATIAWLYLVRRFGLLSRAEVPLLHESRHRPLQVALRYLAPE